VSEAKPPIGLLDAEQAKLGRLLDAYTDGALDLTMYKGRRADIEHDVERARHRLAERDAVPAREPAAPVVRSFADMWSTLSVEVRRDGAGALLTRVRVCQDKTVEIQPRWGEPVLITFTQARQLAAPADRLLRGRGTRMTSHVAEAHHRPGPPSSSTGSATRPSLGGGFPAHGCATPGQRHPTWTGVQIGRCGGTCG